MDVVVIGAGQAGLSSAYHLRRSGLVPDRDFVTHDHSPRPGGAWQFRWDSLTYEKIHGMHALPGMELTGADGSRPSSEVIGEYFAAYEERFGHVFLICAVGLSGAQMLAALEQRMKNDEISEHGVVTTELRKITVLRVRKALAE